MLGVIVEHIFLLVACHIERTCEECSDSSFKNLVFSLTVHTFLMCETVIVAVYHISYTEFLIFPVGICRKIVIGGFHILSVGVIHVILARIQVDEFVSVVSHVISHIDTAGEIEFVGYNLVLVGRYKPVPLVAVD